jgi:mono/diheme cytochrome c family protein
MTPFKDMLKDEEIWNVVNYVRSLAKKPPRS